MPNRLKVYLIFLLCLFCISSEANTALKKCKASFTSSLLSALSDIPFSGRLPLNRYDITVPTIFTTSQNEEEYILMLTWVDVSGFYKKISTDFRSPNPFSYSSDAPLNAVIRGVTYKRPKPLEMKNILDEFLIARWLQIFRGSIWEACFTTITVGENILSGREHGYTYLIEREHYQAIASLSLLIASRIPGLYFLNLLSQSTAVSVFNSLIVRKVSNMKATAFSFSDGVVSYIIVLPILLVSKYWNPVNDKPLLRWIILMMPYLLEQAMQLFEYEV